MRTKKREAQKLEMLEQLYQKHDDRAAQDIKHIVSLHKETTPLGEIKEEGESGELQKRMEEQAYGAMMEEMKEERQKLIRHFDQDTDLKEKVIITGVK